jgi:hypothetical protein
MARGEMSSFCRQDDDPDLIVVRGAIECVVEGVQESFVSCIGDLWSVEHQAGDTRERSLVPDAR